MGITGKVKSQSFRRLPRHSAFPPGRYALLIVLGGLLSILAGAARSKDTHPFNSLKKKLMAKLKEDRVPGALVYIRYPKIGTWSASLGSRDLKGEPLDMHSHMRIGSVTKTFTAAAVLIAVDKGLIDLDTPIETYLPGVVPDGAEITVRDLGDMTSGLFNNTEDDTLNAALDDDPHQVFTVQQSLAIAFRHPRYFSKDDPRCAVPTKLLCWHYSNTNYLVLGMLLEKQTHKHLPELFRDWIFSPLGMTGTIIPPLLSAEYPPPNSRGYLFGTNVQSNDAYKAALKGDVPGSKIMVPPDQPPNDATFWNPSYTWAAGSAISTLSDLVIWAKAYGTGALLSPESFRQQLKRGSVVDYGFGISLKIVPGFIGHNGAIPGFQTVVAYSAGEDATIVVITNSEVAPNIPLGQALPAENLAALIDRELASHRRESR